MRLLRSEGKGSEEQQAGLSLMISPAGLGVFLPYVIRIFALEFAISSRASSGGERHGIWNFRIENDMSIAVKVAVSFVRSQNKLKKVLKCKGLPANFKEWRAKAEGSSEWRSRTYSKTMPPSEN